MSFSRRWNYKRHMAAKHKEITARQLEVQYTAIKDVQHFLIELVAELQKTVAKWAKTIDTFNKLVK